MDSQVATAVAVQSYIKRHAYVDIIAQGKSMYPYIQRGDVCRFESVTLHSLRPGDVILYQTPNSVLVGHRYFKSVQHGETNQLLFRGDSNRLQDAPVWETAILGRLVWVTRKGRTLYEDEVFRKCWTWLIMNVPFVRSICRQAIVQHRVWAQRWGKLCDRTTHLMR